MIDEGHRVRLRERESACTRHEQAEQPQSLHEALHCGLSKQACYKRYSIVRVSAKKNHHRVRLYSQCQTVTASLRYQKRERARLGIVTLTLPVIAPVGTVDFGARYHSELSRAVKADASSVRQIRAQGGRHPSSECSRRF